MWICLVAAVSLSLALSLWRNQLSLSCFWQRHRGLQFIIIIIIIFCLRLRHERSSRARSPQTGWDDAQLQQPKAKHETRHGQQQQQQLQKWDLLLLVLLQRMMMGMMIIIKKHSNFIAHFRSPLKRVLSAGGRGRVYEHLCCFLAERSSPALASRYLFIYLFIMLFVCLCQCLPDLSLIFACFFNVDFVDCRCRFPPIRKSLINSTTTS